MGKMSGIGKGASLTGRLMMGAAGKRAEDLATALAAKTKKLNRLKKEGAPADEIERLEASIADLKKKTSIFAQKKAEQGKAKPIPETQSKPKPKATPKKKPEVSLRNAFTNAKNDGKKTFTYEGEKYNVDAVAERFKKAEEAAGLNRGGMTKKNKGAMDYRVGGMVMSTVDNRKKR